MRVFAVKILMLLLSLLTSSNLFSQQLKIYSNGNLLHLNHDNLSNTASNTGAYLFIGSIVVLTFTPTVIIENKKVYFGLGRELSLVFGKTGEFRISGEYTYIFRSELKSHIRASLKYDILSRLSKSEWIDEREFFSIGAGYFADTDGSGIFPEISAGFRIGGDTQLYLYPYLKARHTFMLKKEKPDNTDFSLGLAIGFKPF